MILLFTIFFNVLEAVYEGLYDRGIKMWSGVVEFIQKGAVVFICINWFAGIHPIVHFSPVWKGVVGFVFVRFLIFDVTYNLVRGLKWNFIDNTKVYGIVMEFFGGFGWFVRVICGIIGIVFLIGIT